MASFCIHTFQSGYFDCRDGSWFIPLCNRMNMCCLCCLCYLCTLLEMWNFQTYGPPLVPSGSDNWGFTFQTIIDIKGAQHHYFLLICWFTSHYTVFKITFWQALKMVRDLLTERPQALQISLICCAFPSTLQANSPQRATTHLLRSQNLHSSLAGAWSFT